VLNRQELADSSRVFEEELVCGFCQDSLKPDDVVVFCPACGAVYHSGCWSENGSSCAVLNCSGSGAIEELQVTVEIGEPRAIDLGPVEEPGVTTRLQDIAATLAVKQWFPDLTAPRRHMATLLVSIMVLGLYYLSLRLGHWWAAIPVSIIYGLVAVFTWRIPEGKFKSYLARIGWPGLPLIVVVFGILGPLFQCTKCLYQLLWRDRSDS
jgi:hypothetical protein